MKSSKISIYASDMLISTLTKPFVAKAFSFAYLEALSMKNLLEILFLCIFYFGNYFQFNSMPISYANLFELRNIQISNVSVEHVGA